tara:strand:+ start:1969 stop:3444 length:1476 start_codon:yes stop_codon:yes gene_type:complete
MGLSAVAKFFIKLAISLYSYNQQRKAQKRQERAARSARSNVLINKQSNNDPLYVLYGRQRMGGTRVFVDTTNGAGDSAGTTKFNMVIAMCEGEIDTVEAMYFNDTVVWDKDFENGTLTANSSGGFTLGNFVSKYAPTIICNWYPGRIGAQTVDRDLQLSVNPNDDGSVWTNAHRLQGVSYFAIQLEADGEKYAGQLPTVTMLLKGKRILDVSTLTAGDTSGDMTAANFTGGADQNPADVLYDYLISDIYGKGLDRDANGNWVAGLNIDIASFQQAKIDCYAARGGLGYNINGFLQTEKQLFDNVGEILETCNGMILFVDGKYQFRIKKKLEQVGIPTSAIFTVDTIIGQMQLSLPSKTRKLNKATGIFNNPDTNYNDDVVIYDNPAWAVEDNGSVLETQEDYTMITDQAQVLDLITQTVNISRTEYTLGFTAPHTALLLRSGDIIEVRHPEFGWGILPGETQKFWRVQELTLTEDNTVEIACTTYDSNKEL